VAGTRGIGTRDGGEGERDDEQREEGANTGHVTSATGCGDDATGHINLGAEASVS